ncbi:MAG: DegV family protein [Ruminococcus sp.]|nr:DegV family protein [Ruminococcus sp.]
MADYKVFTDVPADLPEDIVKKHDLGILHFTFSIDGKDYVGNDEMSVAEFYARLRKGSMAKTSQVTENLIRAGFEPALKAGFDIFMLAFSSGLSASCANMYRIAEDLENEYPGRKIIIIDTLCASLGQGLFVLKALEQKEKGLSMTGLRDWVEANKLHVVHLVVADDLFHLKRGGRISAAAAIAGSALNVKPIIHLDDTGHLTAIKKARGKKPALDKLVDMMAEQIGDWENSFFAISHADDLESAKYLETAVKKRFGIKHCIINYIGTVIGAHTGPGTIALFFMGDYR